MNFLIGLVLFGLAYININGALDPNNPVAWLSWIAAGFCIAVGVDCIVKGLDD